MGLAPIALGLGLSACSLLFEEGADATDVIARDSNAVWSVVTDSRELEISNVQTPGPDRLLVVAAAWCKLGETASPQSIRCGDTELGRVVRQSPRMECGIEFWTGFAKDPMEDGVCTIVTNASEDTDLLAAFMSFSNAAEGPPSATLGRSHSSPAMIQMSRDDPDSYFLGAGMGYPGVGLTAALGNELLVSGQQRTGDKLWVVGVGPTVGGDTVDVGLSLPLDWNAYHMLAIELSSR